MRHIPEDELHAYLDQALSRSQCVEIESHLARCPACRAERDGIAALRDRTTALLSLAAPRSRRAPSWADLEARARADRSRQLRRLRYAGWAASVAAAVAVGWLARDLTPAPAANGAAGEAAVAVTPAPVPAAGTTPTPTAPAPDTTPAPPVRPAPSLASAEPATPPRTDSAAAAAVPAPAGMSLRSADGVLADFPLKGVWRTLSWDRMQQDSGEWFPRVEGLPVKEIRVRQSSAGGLSIVSQQLASGETIRTVAGPASDVRSLLSSRPGQSASAQLQVDPAQADDDRLLAIVGDLPADSLRAMLMRVR